MNFWGFDLPHEAPPHVAADARQQRALDALEWLRPRLRLADALAVVRGCIHVRDARRRFGAEKELRAIRQACAHDARLSDAAMELTLACAGLRENDARSQCVATGPTPLFWQTVRKLERALVDQEYEPLIACGQTALDEIGYALGLEPGRVVERLSEANGRLRREGVRLCRTNDVELSFDGRRQILARQGCGALRWLTPDGRTLARGALTLGWDGRRWLLLGVEGLPLELN